MPAEGMLNLQLKREHADYRRLELIMFLLLEGASYFVWVRFNPLV